MLIEKSNIVTWKEKYLKVIDYKIQKKEILYILMKHK